MAIDKRKRLKPKKKNKRRVIRRTRLREPVKQHSIGMGDAKAIFEIKGQLYITSFPKLGTLQKLGRQDRVTLDVSYCSAVIAESSLPKQGLPRAIVFHLPPKGKRAKEYPEAHVAVSNILAAMPKPTRVELIGGFGKGIPQEIVELKNGFERRGTIPLIKENNIGGEKSKIRCVELRPQSGRNTVFDYSQRYVLTPRDRMLAEGKAKGLTGEQLEHFVTNNVQKLQTMMSLLQELSKHN